MRPGDKRTPMGVVVAISGGGRTLANLLAREAQFAYKIVGVISSSPSCRGNVIAQQAGLPLFVGDFSPATGHQTAEQLRPWLEECGAKMIALGGFLKVFPLNHPLAARVVNIHPALLPKFGGRGMYGERVHAAVIAHGEKESGATIHQVNERYDEGRIMAQVVIAIAGDETPHSLAAKVFAAECDLYPQALHKIASGLLSCEAGFFSYHFTPSAEES